MATTTPSIATTTRNRGPRLQAWLVASIALTLAGGVLVLAVPRTLAAVAALDAETALNEANWERTPKPDDLTRGINGLKRAIEWVPSSKRLIDLAFLELVLALSLPEGSPARNASLADAEAHSIAGLALNPTSGMGWLRLALVREQRGAAARAIVDCLIQSVNMAPNRRTTWLSRVRLLLIYWPEMTPEERLLVRRQVLTIWSAEPGSRRYLVQVAVRANWLFQLYEELGGDPTARNELMTIVLALMK